MLKFLKAQPVLVIAFTAALITVFFIPPDAEYLGYCNKTVLIQLFSLMTAVAGFRSIGVFERVTAALLHRAGTQRRLGVIFVLLCFFSSMLVTNDVALLTLVPLTLLAFARADESSRIYAVVLETAAANLGSMLTPVGNPQNLYLYDAFQMSAGTFLRTLLPAGVLSLVLLLLLTLKLPAVPCGEIASEAPAAPLRRLPLAGFALLFAVCLLTVLRVLPDWVCMIAAIVLALLLAPSVLAKVDYALLMTFVCFFVFVGNIARIAAVRDFLSGILVGRELPVAVLLSQIISNVPAAVMLAGFTENGTALLAGVDLGGLGTLIASLASLISFQIYRKSRTARAGRYLWVFTAVNVLLLIPLLALQLMMKITET